MTDIRPIKRTVELQPLSREHHDGLLFVWKIRQGLNNHTSNETLKSFALWYFKNHIKHHFFQEEKLLLPYFSPGDPLAVRMKEEHDHIRELLLAIGQDPVKQDFIQLANLIESHIRFEEREFFAQVELQLSEQELRNVSFLLEEKPLSCNDDWTDEFWKTPPESVMH